MESLNEWCLERGPAEAVRMGLASAWCDIARHCSHLHHDVAYQHLLSSMHTFITACLQLLGEGDEVLVTLLQGGILEVIIDTVASGSVPTLVWSAYVLSCLSCSNPSTPRYLAAMIPRRTWCTLIMCGDENAVEYIDLAVERLCSQDNIEAAHVFIQNNALDVLIALHEAEAPGSYTYAFHSLAQNDISMMASREDVLQVLLQAACDRLLSPALGALSCVAHASHAQEILMSLNAVERLEAIQDNPEARQVLIEQEASPACLPAATLRILESCSMKSTITQQADHIRDLEARVAAYTIGFPMANNDNKIEGGGESGKIKKGTTRGLDLWDAAGGGGPTTPSVALSEAAAAAEVHTRAQTERDGHARAHADAPTHRGRGELFVDLFIVPLPLSTSLSLFFLLFLQAVPRLNMQAESVRARAALKVRGLDKGL